MKARNLLSLTIISGTLFALGCGGAANTNTANTNASNTTSANVAKKDETVNQAPTLSPVFKAYCEAWAKKDEAALRKVYSSETIKLFEEDMKVEKVKSLLKYLEDDAVTGNICEIRNETITGDKGVAEIKTDTMPNGIKIEFVQENGEWKMTNRSPSVEGVKSSANANGAPAPPAPANKAATDPAAKKDGK